MVPRQALAGLLTVLLAFPAWSNPSVVGTAAASKGAKVRGSDLVAGSTIFSGDLIETGAQGSVSVAIAGGTQVRIGSESQVKFSKSGEQAELEFGQGRTAFRVTSKNALVAKFADATIRPADEGTSTAFVHMSGKTKGIIAAEKGSWIITTAHDAKSITLKEGEGVEVTLAPAPQRGSGAGVSALFGKWILVLGVITIGIITAIAAVRNSNESGLTNTDKRNEVSPFRFP